MCASTLHLSQSHDNHMMCTWYILVFFLSLITSRLEVSILRVINPHFGKVKVCKGSMHSIHCCVLAHTNAVPTDPNLSFSFLDSRTLQSNRIWSVLSTSLVSQSILTPSDHSGGNGKWDQKHWEDLTLRISTCLLSSCSCLCPYPPLSVSFSCHLFVTSSFLFSSSLARWMTSMMRIGW